MELNVVSEKTKVIMSYWQKIVAIAIHDNFNNNNSIMFENIC